MLTRQKTILALLSQASESLSPTVFVKLVFLLRHETELRKDKTFYDFVPYKYGPFSFALYRELANLRCNGYVTSDEERVALCEHNAGLSDDKLDALPAAAKEAVDEVVNRCKGKSPSRLVNDIYARYPWYAINSERAGLRPRSSVHRRKARPAVYTVGYEGKSVDYFFNYLLEQGIELMIDVRARAVSRRYGFSKRRLREIGERLGIDYRHIPELGIPRKYRVRLTNDNSYQRLLEKYERKMLPKVDDEIRSVAIAMQQRPAVLVCLEKDARNCHRSRLAGAISHRSRLEVMHL